MNFARTIYSNHTVLLRFVFMAYTTRDFMTRVSTEVLYITSFSRTLRAAAAEYTPHIQYLIEYYLQARIQVRKLREFNSPMLFRWIRSVRHGTRKRGAGTPDIN